MTICRIKEKITWGKCQHDAWEGDPEGLCLLHSRQENKGKDGKFSELIKQKMDAEDYNFRGGFFPGLNLFPTWTFNKNANFSRVIFHIAGFSLSTFENVTFSKAKFQEADFSETKFQDAFFYRAKFQDADFSLAIFNSANFSEATFQNANFHETTFQKASFCQAKINGRMTLSDIRSGEPPKENQPWLGELQFIEFGEKGFLRLENLSLSKTEFYGTDLRRVEFDRVTWASCWWRAAVYDEILLHRKRWAHIVYLLNYGWLWGKKIPFEIKKNIPEKPTYADFSQVERLYRQLKINYEDMRDFKRVGDFHYGEMEMHRRSSPWRQWVPFSWLNLYRVLSGYGERPLRAFIWLLLLIPAWAGLVWGLGIDQAGSQNPISYGDTLLFIFEKATLQRPPWPTDIKNINWIVKFLANLSVLLLPGQAALFILALRNRLGRRR